MDSHCCANIKRSVGGRRPRDLHWFLVQPSRTVDMKAEQSRHCRKDGSTSALHPVAGRLALSVFQFASPSWLRKGGLFSRLESRVSLPRFSIAVECSNRVTFFNGRKNPLNVVLGGRTTWRQCSQKGQCRLPQCWPHYK